MKNIGGYSLNDARKIALGAARSYLRKQGIDPNTQTAKDAEGALSDLYLIDSRLVASMFYFECSNAQWRKFCKEWDERRKND